MNNFQTWYRTQPPALRAILTINVGFYLFWLIFVQIGRSGTIAGLAENWLALQTALPAFLTRPWGVLTYNFVHMGVGFGGLLHILFNMLWLTWIGREFEQMQGSHRLLSIYVIAGIGGGLLSILFYGLIGGSNTFVHGASASVLGVMAAVATFYPYQSISLLFIGTVRLVWVVVGFLLLDIIFFMDSGTAVAAHVGGALFGFLFAYGEKNGLNLSGWARVFFNQPRSRRTARRPAPARQEEGSFMGRVEDWLGSRSAGRGEARPTPDSGPARVYPIAPSSPAPQPESDVDRILDKISATGYDSLSEEEKRVLYEASKR